MEDASERELRIIGGHKISFNKYKITEIIQNQKSVIERYSGNLWIGGDLTTQS